MIGGNGHIFRASNERNARAFVAEREIFASKGLSRLPKSLAGRIILFVLLAAAVLTLVLV